MVSRNLFFLEVMKKVETDMKNDFHSSHNNPNTPSPFSFFPTDPPKPKQLHAPPSPLSQSIQLPHCHNNNNNTALPEKHRSFYSSVSLTGDTTTNPAITPPSTYKGGHNSKELRKLIRNITRLLKYVKIALFDIDDYKILKQIGEGSYGVIYLVEECKTCKKCALKKIIAHDYAEVDVLLSEFSLVHSINHVNIMKVYGICVRILDVTTIAINVLMEMANTDWDEEIRKRKEKNEVYTEAELTCVLTQLVSALAFMQVNKISHRDIKPQNVLIYRHSVYKVADFGEAKEVKLAKQLNTLRGTEFYMSPILYDALRRNVSDVRHNAFKSDVFSLGFCFIYAATLSFKVIYEIRDVKDMKKMRTILVKYLNENYSMRFIECLLRMVEYDETKRFDFVMLKEYIDECFNEDD